MNERLLNYLESVSARKLCIVIGFFVLSCVSGVNCHGQTTEYLFTTKPTITRPVNFGNYTLNAPFQIAFDYKSTYQTDRYRLTQVWQLGNCGFRFDYATDEAKLIFTVKGIDWTIFSYYAYAILNNKKWHTVICRYDGVKAQFILDNMLIEEKMISTDFNSVTGNLVFSTTPLYVTMGSKYDTVTMDCLAAVIRNVRCGGGWDNISFKPVPVLELDSLDYAPNYNRVNNTYTGPPIANNQLKTFVAAQKRGAKGVPLLGSSINWKYLAGWHQKEISDAQVDINLKEMAKILVDSFGYTLRIDHLVEYYFNPGFYTPIIDLLKANPTYQVDVTTQMSQLKPIDGRVPLTKGQMATLMPNCPNSTFDNERYIYDRLFANLKLTVPNVRMAGDNDEQLDFLSDTTRYQADPACRAAKEATGLTWNQYRSKRFTEIFQYIVNDNVKKYYPDAIVQRYDVYYSSKYGLNPLIDYAIKINSDGCSSPSQYPCIAGAEKCGFGNMRGLEYYFDLVQYCLRNRIGTGWVNAFIGGGWADDARLNLSPAQLSGFTVMLASAGVNIYMPAYFTLTGSDSTGFQNPQCYLFQAVEAAYVQAGLTNPDVWDLYQNSIMQFGNMQDQYYRLDNQPLQYNMYFWTGWKNSLATVRRGTVRTHDWMIFTTTIKPTGTYDPIAYSRKDTIDILGMPVPFQSPVFGKVLVYNDLLPIQTNKDLPKWNPKVVFVGKKEHPGWTKLLSATQRLEDSE